MTPSQRIKVLRRLGFTEEQIAAILGIEDTAVVESLLDPTFQPVLSSTQSTLLTLDYTLHREDGPSTSTTGDGYLRQAYAPIDLGPGAHVAFVTLGVVEADFGTTDPDVIGAQANLTTTFDDSFADADSPASLTVTPDIAVGIQSNELCLLTPHIRVELGINPTSTQTGEDEMSPDAWFTVRLTLRAS